MKQILESIIEELQNTDLFDAGLASFYVDRAIDQLKFALVEIEAAKARRQKNETVSGNSSERGKNS